MSYFTRADHAALSPAFAHSAEADAQLQLAHDKLLELHRSLYRRFRDHGFDLHPHWERAALISARSVAAPGSADTLTLTYFRSQQQAQLVERLMGRDRADWKASVTLARHPVVELRLTPRALAIELIVSPQAWWDQQNFVGKMGVQRHREALRAMLQRVDGDFRIGFWAGTDLDEMHVLARQIVRGNYLNEWMGTFAEGQDWLRVGAWYEVEDPALDTSRIVTELLGRVSALYSLYTFLAWSSNNDYHSVYQKISLRAPGLHHA